MEEQRENEFRSRIVRNAEGERTNAPREREVGEKTEVPQKTTETNISVPPIIERRKPRRKFYRKNGNHRRHFHQKGSPAAQYPGSLNLNNKIVSVVIPLYNEEESVVELSISLKKVLERIRANYEVLFIDDGSTDSSFLKIKEINHLNNRFKCIKFKRNYGKSAALSEGFKSARGDIVITMDADLQDDPEEIPAMIQKLNEGYDLVSGWKKKRYDPFVKKLSSRLFNFVTSKLVGLKLHDYNCGIKTYKKDVVKNIKIYGEMHRYIPALAFLSGFKVSEIPVTHHPRKFGSTKFGASRFINGLFDLMTVLFTTRYIKRPLHLFGLIGLLSTVTGIGIIAYLTVLKFFDSIPISNRPLFLVGILFAIVGVQFISLGLIAEMITKSSSENDNIIIEKTL
jgi:glycosyltransferase involved in cell wall biosynthesis